MKKIKTILITLVSLSFSASLLAINHNEKAVSFATDEQINIVPYPRANVDANFKVPYTYSEVNVKWDSVSTNNKHVRVIARAINDAGKEYVDLSSFNRLEFLVREGVNHEYFSPFLIDSDGDMYFFGTTDSNNYVAGTKCFNDAVTGYPNTKYDPITGAGDTVEGCNYSGIPVYTAEGKQDFVYYHFNINLSSEKAYSDWRSGLGLTPSSNFDVTKVVGCGFNMCKQSGNNQYDWDFGVVGIYGRKQDSNNNLLERKQIFSAEKSVITSSNSEMWVNGYDENGNSYIYIQNNADAGKCVVTVKKDIEGHSKSIDTPLNKVIKQGEYAIVDPKESESAWLYAYSPEYEKSSPMDLSNFDGWALHIKNKTNKEIPFSFYQIFVDGAKTQSESGNFYIYSSDGNIHENAKRIPANFDGWIYSLFESYNYNFIDNLDKAINETRMVIINPHLCGEVKFDLYSWQYQNNLKALTTAKNKAISEFDNVSIDDYREAEKTQVQTFLETAYARVCASLTASEIDSILEELHSIKTDADYQREAIQNEIDKAVNSLTNYVDTLKTNNTYRSEQLEELNSLLSEGISKIQVANSKEEIDGLLNEYIAKADAVLTALEYDKNVALEHINSVDLSLYYQEETDAIKELQQTALTSINNATTSEQIVTIIADFDTAIDAIETMEEKDAEELTAKKEEAKATLTEYLNALKAKNTYSEDNLAALNKILNDAIEDIDASNNAGDILSIVAFSKSQMDDVKSNEQIAKEELDKEKQSAKEELNRYYDSIDSSKLTEEQKTEIKNIYDAAIESIDKAESKESIKQIVDKAKTDISNLLNTPAPIDKKGGCGGYIQSQSMVIFVMLFVLAFIGLILRKSWARK